MSRVAILMATYNGARHLPAQLDSFLAQTHTDWTLQVSDDGSTDDTRGLIEAFSRMHPAHGVSLRDGPQQGYAANFLSLLSQASGADFYAFSDQDDIWHDDKLARAVAWLETVPPETPALYGARTLYVTADNETLFPSAEFLVPPSFANALVQTMAGSNTMVMNEAARALIVSTLPVTIIAHDWWAYQLVSGVGGALHYDPIPCLRYRQHTGNVLGENRSLKAKATRARGLFAGTFRAWNDVQVAALDRVQHLLTPESQQRYEWFAAARNAPLAQRLRGLYSSGIHRQTLLGNFGLVVAALLKRI